MQQTITNDALDQNINVNFTFCYEILFVLDMEWKRYVAQKVQTHGPFIYGLYDIMISLTDCINEWAEEGKDGFRKDESGIHVLFYDLFGRETEQSFYDVDHLLLCLNSIRIYKIERVMDER